MPVREYCQFCQVLRLSVMRIVIHSGPGATGSVEFTGGVQLDQNVFDIICHAIVNHAAVMACNGALGV